MFPRQPDIERGSSECLRTTPIPDALARSTMSGLATVQLHDVQLSSLDARCAWAPAPPISAASCALTELVQDSRRERGELVFAGTRRRLVSDCGESSNAVVQALFIILGASLLLVVLVDTFGARDDPKTTVTEISGLAVAGEPEAPDTLVTKVTTPGRIAGGTAEAPQAEAEPSDSTETTTTENAASSKTTTTEGPKPASPSDAVSLALLGLAGASILTGVFWNRVQSIKAAGIELVLAGVTNPLDALTASIAKLDKLGAEQQVVLKLTRDELAALTSRVAALERGEPGEGTMRPGHDFRWFMETPEGARERTLAELAGSIDQADQTLAQVTEKRIATEEAMKAFRTQVEALRH
jgi:hypothetical protein